MPPSYCGRTVIKARANAARVRGSFIRIIFKWPAICIGGLDRLGRKFKSGCVGEACVKMSPGVCKNYPTIFIVLILGVHKSAICVMYE